MNKDFNFTIGADPEFSINVGKKRLHARDTFQRFIKGNQNSMGFSFPEGEVGWDGCSSTAELRPKFNTNPDVVANNIGFLLEKTHSTLSFIDMKTTNFDALVGGHIHFSIPRGKWEKLVEGKGEDYAKQYVARRLGLYTLPIVASYNHISEEIRVNNYGSIWDMRAEDRGSAIVFEYRSLNAEWITTPKICKATLAYMSVVYNEIINETEKFEALSQNLFTMGLKQQEALKNLTMLDYKKYTIKLIKEIRANIKQFSRYADFTDDIEYLMDIPKVAKEKVACNYNISQGWDFVKQVPMTKAFLDKAKMTEELAKKNLSESVLPLYMIPFNNDTNCEAFSLTLAKHCVAMGYKLKNNYFIYGNKKGVTGNVVVDNSSNFYEVPEQAKTQGDMETLKGVVNRMKIKWLSCASSIGFGLIDTRKSFIIGLPYAERLSFDFTKFLELIYKLEKGTMSPIPSFKELPTGNGELWALYNFTDNEIIPMSGTASYSDAQFAMQATAIAQR